MFDLKAPHHEKKSKKEEIIMLSQCPRNIFIKINAN
ncbi:hypothetical protein C5S32_01895, partial [ANME-1 cluster archaeon GoMg1]|nr:hypothetical protein [ANME-1 cluster archaeon GoMg1]